MISVALGLCEILGQFRVRISGALSIAGHCERKDIIVKAVKVRGIQTVGLVERLMAIHRVALPDQPAEGKDARQS
jgi:hypothetical protein